MKANALPSLDLLFDRFYVDSTSPTGLRRLNGKVAGGSDGRYYRVKIDGTNYLVHRLVLAMRTGADHRHLEADHKDRNRLNNHPFNLRWVTKTEQNTNRGSWGRYSKGVSYYPSRSKPFRSVAIWGGQAKCLGYYETEEEACQARLLELTRLNKEDEE